LQLVPHAEQLPLAQLHFGKVHPMTAATNPLQQLHVSKESHIYFKNLNQPFGTQHVNFKNLHRMLSTNN
jgi:hypothetical protein